MISIAQFSKLFKGGTCLFQDEMISAFPFLWEEIQLYNNSWIDSWTISCKYLRVKKVAQLS